MLFDREKEHWNHIISLIKKIVFYVAFDYTCLVVSMLAITNHSSKSKIYTMWLFSYDYLCEN